MLLSGIKKQNENVFSTIKYHIVIGCFLSVIISLIRVTHSSPVSDTRISKLHSNNPFNYDSTNHKRLDHSWGGLGKKLTKRSSDSNLDVDIKEILYKIYNKTDSINGNVENLFHVFKTTFMQNTSEMLEKDTYSQNNLTSKSTINDTVRPIVTSEQTEIDFNTNQTLEIGKEEFPTETSSSLSYSTDEDSVYFSTNKPKKIVNEQEKSIVEINENVTHKVGHSESLLNNAKTTEDLLGTTTEDALDKQTTGTQKNKFDEQSVVNNDSNRYLENTTEGETIESTVESETTMTAHGTLVNTRIPIYNLVVENVTMKNAELAASSDLSEVTTESALLNLTVPSSNNFENSKSPIPITMYDAPGITQSNDSDNDNNELNTTGSSLVSKNHTNNAELFTTTTVTKIDDRQGTESLKSLDTKEESTSESTTDISLTSTSKEGDEEILTANHNESGIQEAPKPSTYQQLENDDSKPYSWKRICLQGIDKIHYSLDENVIRLPENSADLYLFYYIPEHMQLKHSGRSLYLPSEQTNHYDGGYLKHKYSLSPPESESRKNLSAYSLGHHKLLDSYSNTKQKQTNANPKSTKARASFQTSRSTEPAVADDVTAASAANLPIGYKNAATRCMTLPFFFNQTFGSFENRDENSSIETVKLENYRSSKDQMRNTNSKKSGDDENREHISEHISIVKSSVKKPSPSIDCIWCSDRSSCISNSSWCNNIIECYDKSDEMHCSCRDRMDEKKICDGYVDCPNGEDEIGCFGCPKETFSCDNWFVDKLKGTCIDLSKRCDNKFDCEDHSDEEGCYLLTDKIDSHDIFITSSTSGYLHRNWQGKWYPACIDEHSDHTWGVKACDSELGSHHNVKHVEAIKILPYHDIYQGKFISLLESGEINFVNYCKERGYAVHVECPTFDCGSRVVHTRYLPKYHSKRHTSVGSEEELLRKALKYIIDTKYDEIARKKEEDIGSARVVNGDPSEPGEWPWVVAIYRDGNFYCGGAILEDTWILTAAHCVRDYANYYFEIQAGILRRFSFSPSEQTRMVSHVIIHPEYSHSDMKNDIALLKIDEPLTFNRWVRPSCLPEAKWPFGPLPGTECTAAGWGSTKEKGPEPDHMNHVTLPILPQCRHKADQEGEEICAGYVYGGKDTCQGDSGGPLLCRVAHTYDMWYVGGVVSHGEGCARPLEPGAYTRVALFLPWMVEHTDNKYLTPNRKSKHECPGMKCLHGGRCIPSKKICDAVIDCLSAEDEIDCIPNAGTVEVIYSKKSNDSFKAGSLLSYKQALATKQSATESTDLKTYNAPVFPPAHMKFLPQILKNISENTGSDAVSLENATGTKLVDDGDSSMKEKRETNQYFNCTKLPQIIPSASYCDMEVDCEDGTDEFKCTCADYLKLNHMSLICDGIIHCYDLSDEKYCSDKNCSNDEFFCYKSRNCIPNDQVCDGKKDCVYQEDEDTCYSLISMTESEKLMKRQFDMFGIPLFADKGILAYNDHNMWKWSCFLEENDPNIETTVNKVAKRLQFKNYKEYKHLTVFNDTVLNGENAQNCDGIAVDFGVASVGDEYFIPWRANIHVNGRFACLGVLVEDNWVLINRLSCSRINHLTDYLTAIFGINGKIDKVFRVYEEQIIRADKIYYMNEENNVLMHLEESPRTTKKTKSLKISSQDWKSPKKTNKCFLLVLEAKKSHMFELEVKSNDSTNVRFYKMKHGSKFCLHRDSLPHFSSVICLTKKNEWIFSNSETKWMPCLTNETEIAINPKRVLLRKEIYVNVTQFYENDGVFRCNLGNQIPWNNVCDGKSDCRENEDEKDNLCETKQLLILDNVIQPSTCKIYEFKCNNGRCVPKSSICDNKDDCGDGTDEPHGCSKFNCAVYLNLTSPNKMCDFQQDCFDKSDEDPNICSSITGNSSSSFYCVKSNKSITLHFVCDGERDCDYGEDEEDCMSFNVSAENGTEGTIWMRSNGKWKPECFNSELVGFETRNLCQQLGYNQAIRIEITPAEKRIYTPFTSIKLNDFVDVSLMEKTREKSFTIENCNYIHLSCK